MQGFIFLNSEPKKLRIKNRGLQGGDSIVQSIIEITGTSCPPLEGEIGGGENKNKT